MKIATEIVGKDLKDIPVEKAASIVNQYIDQNDLTQASTDETGLILQIDSPTLNKL